MGLNTTGPLLDLRGLKSRLSARARQYGFWGAIGVGLVALGGAIASFICAAMGEPKDGGKQYRKPPGKRQYPPRPPLAPV